MVAVVVAALPAAAHAQGGGPGGRLSLAEAARRALERHPAVEAATMSEAAAGFATERAEAARLPTLALNASATRYEEPMLVSPLHGFDPVAAPGFDDRLVQASATASYTLFDGGARSARIEQTRAWAGAASAEAQGARASVLRDVTAAYLDVLSLREVLEAHERRLSALEAELARTRRHFEAGRSPELDVLRAEAERGRARADRVRAETRLRVATHSLARLIGYPDGGLEPEQLRPVALADAAPPARDRALTAALRSNPEVIRAREDADASDAAIRLARSRRRPEVKLVAGYTERGGLDEGFDGEWSAGASLSVPLFDGGAAGADVDRARAEAGAADARRRHAELRVRDAVDRAAAAVEEADAQTASLVGTVRQLGEVVRVERLALDAGAGTQTDYLNAEADLLAARASLAETRAAAIAARAELARATGELTLEWLNRTVEVEP